MLCATAVPNSNDKELKDEHIFKKRKPHRKLLRWGYVLAFLSSLLLSAGYAAKYHFFFRSEDLRRTEVFIVNWTLLFVTFYIVAFLLARWYYKIKDKEKEMLQRRFGNK